MLTSFPTLTPNTDALPQWGDITVTAPYSGLIPTGYYDGLETLTANGYLWWLVYVWESFNTASSFTWTPITVNLWDYTYQDATHIFVVSGYWMEWANFKRMFNVHKIDKTTQAVLSYEYNVDWTWWVPSSIQCTQDWTNIYMTWLVTWNRQWGQFNMSTWVRTFYNDAFMNPAPWSALTNSISYGWNNLSTTTAYNLQPWALSNVAIVSWVSYVTVS